MRTPSSRRTPLLGQALCVVCFLAVPLRLSAQSDSAAFDSRSLPESRDTTGVNGARLAIIGGTVAVAVTAIHIYQSNAWWRTNRAPFHVKEDLIYAHNIDKLGHFYAGTLLTSLFSRGLQWSNVPDRPALVWGAVGSTLFQTYIEIEDGFSAYWGFDRVDFAADILGAWYPLIQQWVPPLQNVNMRFSYIPKTEGSQGAISGQTHNMFDDYEGQTIWLAFTMKNILPRGMDRWWPDFLCLSLGVAVRNNNSPDRYLAWFIAPDLDMTKIIPRDTAFLRTLGDLLNFIHFPLPALRFAPNVVWYGIYF
jgi:hypothetical protein